MGDEDQRQAAAALQLDQHGEDLRADRGVEHRDRLVADQAVRLEHERRGDRDALALAAGELVRVAVEVALGVEADVVERPAHARRRARSSATPWTISGSVTIAAHPLARVERLVRVLEDHLRPGGAARAVVALARRPRAPSRTTSPPTAALQAEHRPGQRRLAAARLADDAEDLALAPLERDAVERPGGGAVARRSGRSRSRTSISAADRRSRPLTAAASRARGSTSGHSAQGAK